MALVRAKTAVYLGEHGYRNEGEEFEYAGPKNHHLTYLDAEDTHQEEIDDADNNHGQGTHLDVDLARLKKADLLAHALEHHELELDPALTNAKLVEAIEAARDK